MTPTDLRSILVDRSRTLVAEARHYIDASMTYARSSTEQLADTLEGLGTPIRTLQHASTKFTVVSQRYFEELLHVQAAAVRAALEDGAARLRIVAQAEDLRTLVRDQIERLPASRARISADLRHAAQATGKAGRELRDLAGDTYGRLAAGEVPQQKARAKRAKPTPAKRAAAASKTSTRQGRSTKARPAQRKAHTKRTGGARKRA